MGCPLASEDALQVSSLRITANIFQIWLTVAGFGKFAGGIRNQKRRSLSNYLPDSLHLVAKSRGVLDISLGEEVRRAPSYPDPV